MNRFNLRNKPRISYYEPDEPNLDEYVFCSDCGDFVYEFCSIHGPLLVIPDDKPPTKSPFPPCVPRAALTIPHVFLHIAPSKIPGAGLGVYTTLALPSGVRFGPYVGKKSEEITSMYCWQIHEYNNRRSYVIDAEDPNKSNWMRYVNCSRHWCEQNLIAFQYRGRLYYRTIKIIPRYTELMVFYGSEFANLLHINLKNYNAPTGYAQKFGGPPPQFLSLGRRDNEIPLSTKCVKEESTRSTQNAENNSELADIQKNKLPNDISARNLENNLEPGNKKGKFNVPKQTQNGKNKLNNELSNKRANKKLNSKNITSIKNKQTAENNLQSKEKNISVKPCDFDNKENFPKFSKKSSENNLKTSGTKENKSIHESRLEKNKNIIKKSPKEKNDSFQSETFFQNVFLCNICNFKTSLKRVLATHLLVHGAETKYTCNYCDYITKSKTSLNRHIRIHTGEKPFACNFCKKKFNCKSNLITHIRTHTGEKPFACNFCKKKFNKKTNLNIHIRIHTGEKPFACNFCKKKFNIKNKLNRHIRTHTGEKPFACNFCKKKFNEKNNLNRHIRTHTGEKPFACNFCKNKFNCKSNLITHIRTHTGEKPFACNFCKKKFNKKTNLNIHIRIHTGEKPFACNFCKKKFNIKNKLNRHIRTHTGEKPFACNFYKNKFNCKSNLITHIRTHTEEKLFDCNYCEKKSNTKNI